MNHKITIEKMCRKFEERTLNLKDLEDSLYDYTFLYKLMDELLEIATQINSVDMPKRNFPEDTNPDRD